MRVLNSSAKLNKLKEVLKEISNNKEIGFDFNLLGNYILINDRKQSEVKEDICKFAQTIKSSAKSNHERYKNKPELQDELQKVIDASDIVINAASDIAKEVMMEFKKTKLINNYFGFAPYSFDWEHLDKMLKDEKCQK